MSTPTPATPATPAAPAPGSVLLTVSGTIPEDLGEQIAAGRRPRADYLVMAEAFGGADLMDHAEAQRRTGVLGRLIGKVAGPNAVLAWACFRARRRYRVIFTDGEQVGLLLGCLLRVVGRRRPAHLMIVHIMSVPPKVRLFRTFALHRTIDVFFCYSSAQKRFVEDELGVPAARVVLTPFMVDTQFFQPAALPEKPRVCSVGLELRDYPTLIEAARGLDVHVVIAAGSPWSTRPDTVRSQSRPANVEVVTLPFDELRGLYARSSFVVMPLEETPFQAGITSILEAMAMGRAVVCTRTTGQTDTIVDGVTGLYVPPGDVGALRHAIQWLLDDPVLAARLGAAGRRWVEEHADVEVYAASLAAHVSRAFSG